MWNKGFADGRSRINWLETSDSEKLSNNPVYMMGWTRGDQAADEAENT